MKFTHRNSGREHADISALLPWYVNGSIGEHDRERVDAHLPECAQCRDELAQERHVYEGMRAEPNVEYMPSASLKRLQMRLDGMEAGAPASAAEDSGAAARPFRGGLPWQGLMAASVAVMAVALGFLAADRWLQNRARAASPDYYTVTTPKPRAPNEVIRAVFSPDVTLIELQAILDEAQLRIVSGPTEAGVYSLAAVSSRPVSDSLALLRAHEKVRFAESIERRTGSGDTP
jgi:hypothetical protein